MDWRMSSTILMSAVSAEYTVRHSHYRAQKLGEAAMWDFRRANASRSTILWYLSTANDRFAMWIIIFENSETCFEDWCWQHIQCWSFGYCWSNETLHLMQVLLALMMPWTVSVWLDQERWIHTLWQIVRRLLLLSSPDLLYSQRRFVYQQPVWMYRIRRTRHHLHAEEEDAERLFAGAMDSLMLYCLNLNR